jgi:hypothetical protein
MITDKIIDVLMFREGTDDDDGTHQPRITTGSVVWGILLRSFVLILISTLLLESLKFREYWFLILFLIWGIAIYPGWRQYKHFQEKMESFQEETLCGSCRNFDADSQLCKIYDEHVTKDYIPCQGESWEPNSFSLDNNPDDE